jgi:hypothetical protein
MYADEAVAREQLESRSAATQLALPGDQLVVMVDDHHRPRRKGTGTAVESLLSPDAWVWESELICYVGQVLAFAPAVERRRQRRWFRDHRLWSCSMLTAVWYALRLGLIPDLAQVVSGGLQPATRLINILHIRYAESERAALALLGEEAAERIEMVLQSDTADELLV